MSDLIIPDVSEWQGPIDWPALRRGHPAVIVRAHNGFSTDKYWTTNAAAAAAGSWWGAYQYLPATKDPATAARAFAALVKALPTDKRPDVVIVDIEEGAGDQGPRQAAWHAAMTAALPGEAQWDYSGLYFVRTHGLTGVEWVAAYSNTEPFTAHQLWQYSSSGTVAGVAGNCDVSRFHGTLADLVSLTQTHSPEDISMADAASIQATLDELQAQETGRYADLVNRYNNLVALLTKDIAANVNVKDIVDGVVAALPAGGSVDAAAVAKAVAGELAARLQA